MSATTTRRRAGGGARHRPAAAVARAFEPPGGSDAEMPVTRRDYGLRQLADYLGALYGRVDNARHFGLLPERDRMRGRWSAALAEEIRGRWPEIDGAAKCIGAPGLRERGWTEGMIRDLLGKPDLYVDNPHYKSAASMRLWRLQRAEAIEASPQFATRKERAGRQCAGAARAAETKRIWKALGGV